MPTINDITNAASYTGSKELGGFVPSAIDIDTKPVQTLAAYTVIQNKANYDQRQIDADQKIKELAELAQYDITDARGKDRDELVGLLAQIEKDAREHAMKGVPKSPQGKIQQELEFQTKVRDAKAKIVAMNERKLGYQLRLNAINSEKSDAKVKAAKKAQLDNEFNSTDWRTPISAQENFEVVLPKIGDASYTKNTTSVDNGQGEIVQQTVSIFNMKKTAENSLAEFMGLQQPPGPDATEEEIRQWEITQASGGQMKILQQSVENLNAVLADPKYRNQDGTLNIDAVKNDNKLAYATINGIQRWNEYAAKMKENVRRGFFTTQLGKKVNLLGIVNEDDYFTIDPNKPISVENAISIEKFLKAAPDTKEEKIIQTNDDIEWFNAQTSRINALKSSASASSGSKGAVPLTTQSALLFAEHINNIKKRNRGGAVNVTVSYKGTDEITRRALGLEEGQFVTYRPDGTAMVGSDAKGNGGRPLTIEQQKFNFIAAVKGGSKEESTMDDKFITGQEEGFRSIFDGATDAKAIWNGWGAGGIGIPETITTTAPKTKVVNGKTLVLPQ